MDTRRRLKTPTAMTIHASPRCLGPEMFGAHVLGKYATCRRKKGGPYWHWYIPAGMTVFRFEMEEMTNRDNALAVLEVLNEAHSLPYEEGLAKLYSEIDGWLRAANVHQRLTSYYAYDDPLGPVHTFGDYVARRWYAHCEGELVPPPEPLRNNLKHTL